MRTCGAKLIHVALGKDNAENEVIYVVHPDLLPVVVGLRVAIEMQGVLENVDKTDLDDEPNSRSVAISEKIVRDRGVFILF